MDAQIVLRQVASSADDFPKLYQVAGGGAYACIQRQAITFGALQLKTDPVVGRASFRTQDHRLADKVLDHCFHPAVIKKIAYGEAAAHLLSLQCGAHLRADIAEGSVMLVQEQEFWLEISGCASNAVYLRIHMAVYKEKILPAIIGEIYKSVAPADIALRAAGNS